MESHAALQGLLWIKSNKTIPLSITTLVKPHGIPYCAIIECVLDFIELLIHGWPEDGLLEVETCSHPTCILI
jgi:hypothetical protein